MITTQVATFLGIALVLTVIWVIGHYCFGVVPCKLFSKPVRVGDRIRLSEGYQIPPEWLGIRKYIDGTVLKFIDNPWDKKKRLNAIVQLDDKVNFRHLSGDIVVLSLRYVGSSWKGSDYVHIELYDHIPARVGNSERWIESHAKFHRL